jgi:hypothetical protein
MVTGRANPRDSFYPTVNAAGCHFYRYAQFPNVPIMPQHCTRLKRNTREKIPIAQISGNVYNRPRQRLRGTAAIICHPRGVL